MVEDVNQNVKPWCETHSDMATSCCLFRLAVIQTLLSIVENHNKPGFIYFLNPRLCVLPASPFESTSRIPVISPSSLALPFLLGKRRFATLRKSIIMMVLTYNT